MKLRTKNWQEFQHYKDRNPAWIKLHKKLLDNYEYQCLQIASKALAPMLWLIASESDEGVIDASPAKLAFRLRMTEAQVEEALGPLIGNGFFEVVEFDKPVASKALAECKQPAMPEKRREEKETPCVASDTAFARFWETWPTSPRKVAKVKCLDVWRRHRYETSVDRIVAHIESMRDCEQWRKGFEPAPLTYLNQRRWEDGGSPPADTRFAGAI